MWLATAIPFTVNEERGGGKGNAFVMLRLMQPRHAMCKLEEIPAKAFPQFIYCVWPEE